MEVALGEVLKNHALRVILEDDADEHHHIRMPQVRPQLNVSLKVGLRLCVGSRPQGLDGHVRGAPSDDAPEIALVDLAESPLAQLLIEADARDGKLPRPRPGRLPHLHRRSVNLLLLMLILEVVMLAQVMILVLLRHDGRRRQLGRLMRWRHQRVHLHLGVVVVALLRGVRVRAAPRDEGARGGLAGGDGAVVAGRDEEVAVADAARRLLAPPPAVAAPAVHRAEDGGDEGDRAGGGEYDVEPEVAVGALGDAADLFGAPEMKRGAESE